MMKHWMTAQPIVSAFVTSMVRDFAARDDILQEVAVALLETFDRYDPERPFVGWALGVARNKVSNYLRDRQKTKLMDEGTIDQLTHAFSEMHDTQAPTFKFLQDCLTHLDPRAKKLCELRYGLDLKPAAIAHQLGSSPNAIAKNLQRIRDQLRLCIERKAGLAGGSA